MKLFELKPNDYFVLYKIKFQLIQFKKKRLPTMGVVVVAMCQNLKNGKSANFLRNWEVAPTSQKE